MVFVNLPSNIGGGGGSFKKSPHGIYRRHPTETAKEKRRCNFTIVIFVGEAN